MTDQELAQEVANRLWAAEAAAADNPKRLRQLKRAHKHLASAHKMLLSGGDVQPLSGSPLKP